MEHVNSFANTYWVAAHEYGFPEGTSFVVNFSVRCPDPDAELKRLAPHLSKFRRVDIYAAGTEVSDNGLRELHGVTVLNELLVDNTKVTSEGLELLESHLGNCRVVHTIRNWYPPH